MKRLTIAALAALSFAAVPALASQELAKNKGCMECHASANQVYGPSFSNIGNLYKGTPDAQKRLAKLIMQGEAGHWGTKEMPAHLNRPVPVNEADAMALASWILKQ